MEGRGLVLDLGGMEKTEAFARFGLSSVVASMLATLAGGRTIGDGFGMGAYDAHTAVFFGDPQSHGDGRTTSVYLTSWETSALAFGRRFGTTGPKGTVTFGLLYKWVPRGPQAEGELWPAG